MNITLVTPYLPYPDVPHGGGQDLFRLIQTLGERHQVRVAAFVDESSAIHAEALRPHVIDMRLVWPATTVRRKVGNVLKVVAQGGWFQLGRRAELEMREVVATWPADVVHAAWTEMGRYLPSASPNTIRVLDEVDVRFLVEELNAPGSLWVAERKAAELDYCRQADLVITRSQRDLDVLRQQLPELNGLVIPPAANVQALLTIPANGDVWGRVLFVGHMGRRRNQAAVQWLVNEIWPLILEDCPWATLHVVGAEPPRSIRALGRKRGVLVTGWIKDLRRAYVESQVVVAPMRSEAGALNKVLDGLASGRTVVATSRANGGIGAPSNAIVLEEETRGFAAAVVSLLNDAAARCRQGLAGRRFVRSAFSWPDAVRRYETMLERLVAREDLENQESPRFGKVSKTTDIVTVVVNWNGRDDTLTCLDSLEASKPVPKTLVVDNGSTDGSVPAIANRFPAVEIITLPGNQHFAAAANIGIRRGQELGAEYICLLNNDVIVQADALAEMVRVAESDAGIGIVGAKLIHPFDPPGVIVGAMCDFRTGAIVEPTLPEDPGADRLPVDYVWGCALLLRAQALSDIGALEAAWIAYFEDTDFCLRACKAGWRTVTALQAVVHHTGSKSANRVFLQQMWLRGRNWWRCYWRHAPPAVRPQLAFWMWGYRLPHLLWSTLVTIAARKLRPRGRPIRLWGR